MEGREKNYRKKLYEMHADFCKIFTNPKRVEIIYLLSNGEKTVNELAAEMQLSQSNVSQHLALLRQRGIVKTRRQGNNLFYSLSNKKILKACNLIKEILIEKEIEKGKMLKELAA